MCAPSFAKSAPTFMPRAPTIHVESVPERDEVEACGGRGRHRRRSQGSLGHRDHSFKLAPGAATIVRRGYGAATGMTGSLALTAGTPQFESLLIVRLSAMGDIIHTLPAAAALRQAFPHATLGWLVEERWAELLCTLRYPRSGQRSPQRPLVDRVHSVNTAEWRHAPRFRSIPGSRWPSG
jgi:hypothetical protein